MNITLTTKGSEVLTRQAAKKTQSQSRSKLTRLDEEMIKKIMHLRQNVAVIKASEKSFLSLLVQCPMQVKLKSFNVKQTKELDILLTRDWQEWHRQMYIWINTFGVFPYYFRKIRGTIHYRPVVPSMKSGYISSYLDANKEQQFQWTWTEGEEDGKFHFITGTYKPEIDGTLNVPLTSLVGPYETLQEAVKAQKLVWYAQSHPQHILEYKPTNASLKEIDTFQEFMTGEQIMGINPKRVKELRTVKIRNATESIRRVVRNNVLEQQKSLRGGYMFSDPREAEANWEKKNAALLDHIVPLDADFVYKPVPAPRLEANVMDLRNQIEKQAASLMDFPIEPFSATTQRFKTQSENDLRFLNERVKTWINFIEKHTQRALIQAYGKLIQNTFDKAQAMTKTDRIFLAAAELTVEMQCTPITTWDELVKYVDRGIMSEEDFAMHAYRLKALPLTQIQIPEEEEAKEPEPKRSKKA